MPDLNFVDISGLLDLHINISFVHFIDVNWRLNNSLIHYGVLREIDLKSPGLSNFKYLVHWLSHIHSLVGVSWNSLRGWLELLLDSRLDFLDLRF